MEKPTEHRERILILSIRREHAERIFQGTKRFELRKRLPINGINRVYLYESGGRGIVGCFDVTEILVKPVPALWDAVGELAATESRFYSYFSGRAIGFAIGIANPLKFRRSIFPAALKASVPTFTAPMSFLTLSPGDKLYRVLERYRHRATHAQQVLLEPITREQYAKYASIVTKEISARYDEITPRFAKSVLRSHRLGRDPNGIFTKKKEILEIRGKHGALLGFTTLTYKIGGSVKTGPTILMPRYRKKGYGRAVRLAVHNRLRLLGIRKVYCTCPDYDMDVVSYLLSSGYVIEAHLQSHYRVGSGEFVFGYMLADAGSSRVAVNRPLAIRGEIVDASAFTKPDLVDGVLSTMVAGGLPLDIEVARAIVTSGLSQRKTYEDKPCAIFCVRQAGRCVATLVLLPKRGGAIKALCGTLTSDPVCIEGLLDRAERHARDSARRKIYFVMPHNDALLNSVLRDAGYHAEGILREPYNCGVDCIIFAKLL